MWKQLTAGVIQFLKDEDGPTSTEYAINLALIGTVVVSSATSVGNKATQSFKKVSNTLANATSGS